MYAYMLWADTTAGIMKMRNGANSAWISLWELDGTFIATDISLSAGTAGAPSLYFTGDTNTGIYSPGADQVAVSTGGTARITVDASGNVNIDSNTVYVDAANNRVGIGDSAPSAKLVCNGHVQITSSTTPSTGAGLELSYGQINASRTSQQSYNRTGGAYLGSDYDALDYRWYVSGSEKVRLTSTGLGIGTTSPGSILAISDPGTGLIFTNVASGSFNLGLLAGTGSADAYVLQRANAPLLFGTNNAERLRIDSSGRLLVGTSTGRRVGVVTAGFEVIGDVDKASISSSVYSNDTAGPYLSLGKSRGVSDGSYTIVALNDQLGHITFAGADGSNLNSIGASITANVDGTPGAADMPGRLVFSTTADGAASPTERMRIQQNGNTWIGTTTDLTSDQNKLSVSGTRAIVGRATGGATNPVITAWNNATSGDNYLVSFRTETSDVERGLIDYNRAGGQVRYNVTSDRRLKSAIQPATSAVNLLSSIQVRSYKWTETGYTIDYGFIAQELNQVLPDAVKVGDDGEEITDTWAVDNSKLVPLLTKALQEAIAKIEVLETRLSALEGA
jgi:hypothetical protein